MALNRIKMTKRGITMAPTLEAGRWLREDLAKSPLEDAEFVKRYTERRRANVARLFEFSALALTLIVAMLAIPGALSVEAIGFAWIAFAVLLALLLTTHIWGLVIDDRLDRIDDRITLASAAADRVDLIVKVMKRKKKWRVRSHSASAKG